ncbi:hypothetical protein LRN48_14170, partial [Staphylococcus aureus]|nr:hypothetical protein [Staphylococcus aureus]
GSTVNDRALSDHGIRTDAGTCPDASQRADIARAINPGRRVQYGTFSQKYLRTISRSQLQQTGFAAVQKILITGGGQRRRTNQSRYGMLLQQ